MGLVVLRRFHTLPEAQVAATLLGSAGLSPAVFDQHYGGLDWVAQSALGGYRLLVPDAELEDARALLLGPHEAGELPPGETPPPPITGGEIRSVGALAAGLAEMGGLGWLIAGARRRTGPSLREIVLGGALSSALAATPFLLGATALVAIPFLVFVLFGDTIRMLWGLLQR